MIDLEVVEVGETERLGERVLDATDRDAASLPLASLSLSLSLCELVSSPEDVGG